MTPPPVCPFPALLPTWPRVGAWTAQRPLGGGGMGRVYAAHGPGADGPVALKLIDAAQSATARARLLQEARAAAAVRHPHLVRCLDIGEACDVPYLVMEIVSGGSAEDLLPAGPAPEAELVALARGIGSALAALHAASIVHRDIKPANIMVMKDGTVKLADFGFIQQAVVDRELMQEGTTIGTPDYISPEQARGERDLDVRSDIYSLGASVYHMVGGKTMYSGSCSSVMRAHIDAQPPKLKNLRGDVPERLVEIIQRMTAKSPIDRQQTPEDVQKDLEVLKLDLAGNSGELPTSKSGILNVINAEKERIATLERQLKEQRVATWVWMGASIAAIAVAAVFAVLWLGGR